MSDANDDWLAFVKNARLRAWVERHTASDRSKTSDRPFKSAQEFVEDVLLSVATQTIPLCSTVEEEQAAVSELNNRNNREEDKEFDRFARAIADNPALDPGRGR